jgi:hypothetical protein
MDIGKLIVCAMIASLLALAGCATSPEDEQRRKDMEADVDDILSYELDPLEYGKPKTCLSDHEYRSYRALGKRHLLFRGRQGRLWVNVLRGRCSGLYDDSVFIMKPNMPGRLCDTDRFEVVDRLNSLSDINAAAQCALGEFKPVTAAQVKEIENRLEMR